MIKIFATRNSRPSRELTRHSSDAGGDKAIVGPLPFAGNKISTATSPHDGRAKAFYEETPFPN